MKLGTGERMNKQISGISPKMTVPMFMIGLIIFVVVAINVIHDTLLVQNIDIGSLHWLTDYFGKPERKYGDGIWHNFMTFCAEIGEVKSVIYITLFLAIVLLFKHYKFSIWMMLTITSGTLLNYLVKQLIERQRPFNHLMRDHGYSFPSGHSNASTLLALILLIILIPLIKFKAIRIIASIITIIIWIGVLCCRLYFHAHYITDVVGGVTLGIIWVALFLMILPLFYLNLRNKPNNK